MKKVYLLLVAIVVLVMLSSCYTYVEFDTELLKANGRELEKKLPTLKIERSFSQAYEATNEISSNTYLYTIWERELEENIMEDYGSSNGSIELVIINNHKEIVGIQDTISSAEVEIRIYNLKGTRVWKHSYSGETERFFVQYLGYEEYGHTTLNKTLALYKMLIEQAKTDIERDYDLIVSRLNENI